MNGTPSFAGGLFARIPFASNGLYPMITGDNLKEIIVSTLRFDADLTALIGLRIHPVVVPRTGALPALTYKFISAHHVSSLRGATGITWIRVRFEIRSHNHSDLEPVREVLRNRFQSFMGLLGPLFIIWCEMEPELDGYDQPLPGSDTGTHWKRMDYQFKYRETLPTRS